MKRNVKVEITNVQQLDGDRTIFVSHALGFYNTDTKLLSYSEEQEDGPKIITNIRIKDGIAEVKKMGGVVSTMIFDADNKTEGHYLTSIGKHNLMIDTTEVREEQKGKYLRIILKYCLEMDGQLVGSNDMCITATFV